LRQEEVVSEAQSPSALEQKRRGWLLAALVAMRPKQWTKNLLLFAGLLFTIEKHHSLHDFSLAFAAFAIFSILSSCGYLLNDALDVESDRKHPVKRFRPIASGELTTSAALILSALMAIICLIAAFAVGTLFGFSAAAYLATTILYSFKLKHIVIMDLIALAIGFVLRAVAGALAIPVPISPWLVLCTLLLALFLGIAKRRGELVAVTLGRKHGRAILSEYSSAMLDQMSTIVTSALLMSYALYTIQSDSAQQHHALMGTIPFVIYGIFRYLYLIHRHDLGEAPDEILLKDRPLLLNIVLWAIVSVLIMFHPWER
jgi:4-hydroxybenzoate polyprenyltransferase